MSAADETDALEPSLSRLAVAGMQSAARDRDSARSATEATSALPRSRPLRPYVDTQLQPMSSTESASAGLLQSALSPASSGRENSPALTGSLMFASSGSHEKHIPRNVSFTQGSEASMAYREHNPPTILRQDAAAHKHDEPLASPRTAAPVLKPVASPKESEAQKSKARTTREKRDELHILIGVTGSVATIKVGLIVHKLKQIYRERAIIQLVATKASCVFFKPADVPRDVKIWYDEDEWQSRDGKPDSSLHMELRRWADILLVAPCSANTLAKLTYGICDNLLTSVFRVWNPSVPLLVAPAMNTHMYTNPVTKRHYKVLKDLYPWVEILRPVEKVLVCGDIGMGGMREWTDIVQILVRRLGVEPDVDDDDDGNDDDDS